MDQQPSSGDPLNTLEKNLVTQLSQVKKQLEKLEHNDLLEQETLPEVIELGSFAWEADVRSGNQAVKANLMRIYLKIKDCLIKLKKGTYGLCEKCHKNISLERLAVLPTASTCAVCF
ncbi:TraR/DksA C4-type zinc finger protein [Candidatus Daviesbacteria bacterium]|nr:TraR/DksA C4-type zinc finger protein [Candidatus Daviesbacteria bacterium]